MASFLIGLLTLVVVLVSGLSMVGVSALLKTASTKHRIITECTYTAILMFFLISVFISIWS